MMYEGQAQDDWEARAEYLERYSESESDPDGDETDDEDEIEFLNWIITREAAIYANQEAADQAAIEARRCAIDKTLDYKPNHDNLIPF